MEVSDVEELRSPAGEAVFASITAGADPLATATRLRAKGHDPELVAAALTQARLRRRAAAKLGEDAEVMLFTPDSVEQATRATVAAHRAARLARTGIERVFDLGCGAGADLIALARAGLTVVGIERDPVTAAVAAANVEALGLADRATVRCADATTITIDKNAAVFCDPARRSGGRRVFNPDAYAPPWSFLLDLATRVPMTVFKVAPGIDHDRLPATAEAEWVSERGDVVEAALWFGPLAEVARRATLLAPAPAELTGGGTAEAPVGPLREYLYDPDGAVIRAHLVAEFAATVEGTLVDPAIAYVTTDAARPTPYGRGFTVLEVMPFGVKRLRAALRDRGVGSVEIKKRGSAVTPEELRPQLRLPGRRAGPSATVILTRVGTAPIALICQPVSSA